MFDIARNQNYREQCLRDYVLVDEMYNEFTHGRMANQWVSRYLNFSELPMTDVGMSRQPELKLCTMDQAREVVEGNPSQEPVVVMGWEAYSWDLDSRPIEQFCGRLIGDLSTICVQTPSQPVNKPSFTEQKLRKVINIFLNQKTPSLDPINCLDLQNPISCGRPPFLNNANCSMLSEIRQRVLGRNSAHRITAGNKEYRTWHELESWALLSQGGNVTAPHTDSHGLATWISPQEAGFGFGWLSRPSKAEFTEWAEYRELLCKGPWRYVFLEPGQTIFFPSGTIHYVFRSRDRQTLAFGGHLLQWSNTSFWLDVLEVQLKHPKSTNEEMGDTLVQMLKAVDSLIGEKITRRHTDFFGGQAKAKAVRRRVKVC